VNWHGACAISIGFILGNILMAAIFASGFERAIELSFFQVFAIFATAYVIEEKKPT
jgi:hypothetical protein